MCATCGCSEAGGTRLVDLRPHTHADGTTHSHGAEHGHSHEHSVAPQPATETMTLETRVLAKNDELASRNRDWLATRGVVAVNLMSSPGAGKTTLLQNSIPELMKDCAVWVVEGDQETTYDAERILMTGAPVVQINTGAGCHLDAEMVETALTTLNPSDGVVLVENVGNLVCPALFDLGESARVVIMSVTEGADKPMKYPHIFRSATVIVLNKIDLVPYVDFDAARFAEDVARLNPAAEILSVSATRGDGLERWIDFLTALRRRASP